jgi:peptidoglycan/xylan/chitin deacetylase (PgdA/CDA1 family)
MRALIALAVLLATAIGVAAVAACTLDGEGTLTIEALRDGGGGAVTGRLAQPEPTPAPAPPPKRVRVSTDEVIRGPDGVPKVSLVINAGAGYEPATDQILAVLASRNVTTTFFIMGWWAEKFPDHVARIHAAGHEIAQHGYKVFDLTKVSDAEVAADLERADQIISGITGQTTRPLWSASAGNRDARVRAVAARLGYRTIVWSINSGDWRTDTTAESVLRLSTTGLMNGSIVELHMDSPRTLTSTAVVLGQIIDTARARGLEPVTITELVGE